MRRLVAAVLLALLPSCSKADESPQRAEPAHADAVWLATKAAAALAKTFRAVGLDATAQGTTLSVADRTVMVTARINNRLQQNGRHILAAQFDVSVDGIQSPALLAGAIGVDDTPERARDTAAAEWAAQYGVPIGFALASQFGASSPPARGDELAPLYVKLEVDGQALFHGPPGVRGAARTPGAISSREFVTRVAEIAVASLRRKAAATGYRSALVQVLVTGAAVTGGECRVDGLISPELLDALSKLPWPEAAPSYVFKLFFVGVAGRSPGEKLPE